MKTSASEPGVPLPARVTSISRDTFGRIIALDAQHRLPHTVAFRQELHADLAARRRCQGCPARVRHRRIDDKPAFAGSSQPDHHQSNSVTAVGHGGYLRRTDGAALRGEGEVGWARGQPVSREQDRVATEDEMRGPRRRTRGVGHADRTRLPTRQTGAVVAVAADDRELAGRVAASMPVTAAAGARW